MQFTNICCHQLSSGEFPTGHRDRSGCSMMFCPIRWCTSKGYWTEDSWCDKTILMQFLKHLSAQKTWNVLYLVVLKSQAIKSNFLWKNSKLVSGRFHNCEIYRQYNQCKWVQCKLSGCRLLELCNYTRGDKKVRGVALYNSCHSINLANFCFCINYTRLFGISNFVVKC